MNREELIRQIDQARNELHEKLMQAEEWAVTVGPSLKALDLEGLVSQLDPLLRVAKWALDGLETELSIRMPMSAPFYRLAILAIKNVNRIFMEIIQRSSSDEILDEGAAIKLVKTFEAAQKTANLLMDRMQVLLPKGGAGIGSDEESERVSYPYDYRPPHYHGKGKGRKINETFETQELRDSRKQGKKDIFFSEETGSLEPQEALFFQEHGLTPEKREAYIQTPEAPEITEADIYDVIYCRGKWKRLAYGGWPCGSGGPRPTADDIERAVQYLIFQGYRLRP